MKELLRSVITLFVCNLNLQVLQCWLFRLWS